jgi:hypothetical protein
MDVHEETDNEDFSDDLWSLGHPVGPTQEMDAALMQAVEAMVGVD